MANHAYDSVGRTTPIGWSAIPVYYALSLQAGTALAFSHALNCILARIESRLRCNIVVKRAGALTRQNATMFQPRCDGSLQSDTRFVRGKRKARTRNCLLGRAATKRRLGTGYSQTRTASRP